jgi:hypothetical protein
MTSLFKFLHPGQGGGWSIYSDEGGVVYDSQVGSGRGIDVRLGSGGVHSRV